MAPKQAPITTNRQPKTISNWSPQHYSEKYPIPFRGEFIIDSDEHEVNQCPAGNKPYKTSYFDETGMYRASFDKKTCESCPFNNQCAVKFQKKSAVVMISEKIVQRASYLKKCQRKNTRTYPKNATVLKGCLPSCADVITWIISPSGISALKNVVFLQNRCYQCKESAQKRSFLVTKIRFQPNITLFSSKASFGWK